VTEELIKLKAHEKALETFLDSPAHTGFVAARQEELRLVKDTILELDPVRREDEIEQYKLRGEMRVLEGLVGCFPDALEELRDRISDLEDEENTRK
jgi:hypothetical protein